MRAAPASLVITGTGRRNAVASVWLHRGLSAAETWGVPERRQELLSWKKKLQCVLSERPAELHLTLHLEEPFPSRVISLSGCL